MPSSRGLRRSTIRGPQAGQLLEVNSVGAIIKLRGYDNVYLYITGALNPQVVAHVSLATPSDRQRYGDSGSQPLRRQAGLCR